MRWNCTTEFDWTLNNLKIFNSHIRCFQTCTGSLQMLHRTFCGVLLLPARKISSPENCDSTQAPLPPRLNVLETFLLSWTRLTQTFSCCVPDMWTTNSEKCPLIQCSEFSRVHGNGYREKFTSKTGRNYSLTVASVDHYPWYSQSCFSKRYTSHFLKGGKISFPTTSHTIIYFIDYRHFWPSRLLLLSQLMLFQCR